MTEQEVAQTQASDAVGLQAVQSGASQMGLVGFIFFTLISAALTAYILYNSLGACKQNRTTRKSWLSRGQQIEQQLLSEERDEGLAKGSTQFGLEGRKFKTSFFASLFVICLLRTVCLVLMTIKKSSVNAETSNDGLFNIVIRLSLDLPTLMLIGAFSAFAYYLSRLNLELETILHDFEVNNAAYMLNERQEMAHDTFLRNEKSDNYLKIQAARQHAHGNQSSGFAKMFFFISNILLAIFYIVCFAKYTESIYHGRSEHFTTWVRSFTGIAFLVLGILILKYGSQLETTVTHSISLRQAIASEMDGLDVKILTITIVLSLVFLSRALLDCMFAFSLINRDLNSYMMLLSIIVFSEVCTSAAVVKLLKKSRHSKGGVNSSKANDHFTLEIEPIQEANQPQSTPRKQDRKSNLNDREDHLTKLGSTEEDEGSVPGDHLNYSFTSYGNFNPNLVINQMRTPQARTTQICLQQMPEPGHVSQITKKRRRSNYLQFIEAQKSLGMLPRTKEPRNQKSVSLSLSQ